MRIGRSSNPALTKSTFTQAMYRTADERAMTIQGTVNKSLILLILVLLGAVYALNLVLDFDFIEEGAKAGAPKYMEWYAASGLMITLIWLYIEILRLLTKLASRK